MKVKYVKTKDNEECIHSYSKSINEPRPRMCVHCGQVEHHSDMNIFALKGHKVMFVAPNNGTEWNKEQGKKYLKLGDTYTVNATIVGGSHTDVFLNEFPDVRFNSVQFYSTTNQPAELDCNHPDYDKFN